MAVKGQDNLKLKDLRVLFETDSREKLQNALGIINADMQGRLEDFKKSMEKQ